MSPHDLPGRRSLLIVAFLVLAIFGPSLFANSPEPKKIFSAAFYPEQIDWNPLTAYSALEAQLYTAVYEGLMSYNPNTLRPELGVANRFEVSQDKKVYTFYLRPEAQFWDGTAIKAKIFRDSWIKLLDPSTNSPFAGLLDPIKGAIEYRTGKSKDSSTVAIRVIDDLTLKIELNSPTAYFIQLLCHQSLVPVHPKLLNKKVWDSTTEIIGNGPFMFTSRKPDLIELDSSPSYWDKSTLQVDGLRLILKDDPAEITRRFNDGEIHWIESGADFDSLSDHYSFHYTPQFASTFMYFSGAKPAFRNPLVRKGLALMLPFDKIRSKDNFMVPSAQLIPEIPDYPSAQTIDKTDIKAGLNFLAEAGFPNGKGLPEIIIFFPKSDTWHSIAEEMKLAWKDLKVKVTIKESDTENLFDSLKASDFTIATISWIGDYADPMTFLDLWSSTSSLNKSGFSSTKFDDLLKESNSQQGKDRLSTLSKAEEYLLTTGQVLPINHSPAFNVIDLSRISGWYENALNVHPFKFLEFKALKPPRSVAMN